MENVQIGEKSIDISKIPDAPRYFFPVSYIFTGKYETCSAFEKVDFETGFHVQEFYELCIISRGEGYHIIEDTAVKAVRGDVFIVPPGRKHAFIGGKGFNIYYIHLTPDFLETNTPKLKNLPTFFSLFEIEPLMRVNGAVYRHLFLEEKVLSQALSILDTVSKMHQHDEATKLIMESYIIIVLTILCDEYAKMQTIIGKNANNDKLFMDSISYILENFNKKITIEDLAQLAGMSRSAYLKKFAYTVGTPPRHFIMHRRITVAKNLLSRTDKPITKIAEDCGFYDAAHFGKCFIAEVGTSPSEYRKSSNKS